MDEFNLDLRTVEDRIDWKGDAVGITLGVLDGSTPPTEWIEAVESGEVLVLAVEGDLNELAAGFARDVRDLDGELIHFRSFLIVVPPGVAVDTDRL